MSVSDLFIVGTPAGQGQGGATAWWAAAGTVRGLKSGGGERAWLELDAVAQRSPDAGWLVFVENPATGLAAALAAGEAADPLQWLSAWCVGARRVLRQVQRAEARCLLVDADEARCDTEVLARACQQRFGTSVKASFAPALTAFDPLSLALGQALVFADRGVQELYSELQASCALFDADAASAFEGGVGLQIDAEAAAKRLRDLHLAEQALVQSDEELVGLRLLSANAAAALQRMTTELSAEQAAATQRRDELKAAGEENELIFAELHQVQEELEVYYLRCRELEAGAALAVPVDELYAAQQAAVQAAEELAILRAHANAAAVAEQQKAGELATAHSAIDQHVKRFRAAGEENELMLLQLQQVQEEVEHYYLECRRLEGAASTVTSAAQIDLAIEQVQPVTERGTHPYRELTFTLQQVKVGERTLPQARVRLVEHHGHPGLVVFANAQGAQLLTAWRQSGQEDGMSYMLLVPSDAESRPVFDAMDSTDWLVTLALVSVLERRLTDPVLLLAPHWQQLARRLREQLQEMPRRFRYGSLAVSPVGELGSGVLAFNFGQVHFGARQLPQLTVHWRPSGPQAGLELLCGPDAVPPLLSWPDDELGVVPDRLRLPLGHGLSKQERRLWRQRVTPGDLDFVRALLAVWPQALLRVPPDLLGGEAQAQRLTQAAASLTNDALPGTPSQPWGGMLSRLTGQR